MADNIHFLTRNSGPKTDSQSRVQTRASGTADTPILLDAKRAERTSSASQTEASRASDTVTLTDAAKKAAGATKIATENSGVDLDKVERIKRAIAEGKYPLDPDAIADKMVSLNSLLSPPPGIQR